MDSKKPIRDYSYLFLIAGLIVLVDQITKSYIRANFTPYVEMWAPWDWLLPYARIVHVHNTGVAFGMMQGMNVVFATLAVIVSIAIIYYFSHVPAEDWTLRLAMAMQLGGAVGNLIDRLTVGHVTDFVSVGNFPVFNVADSSISIGVVVLILGVYMQERRQKREAAARHAVEQPADGENSTAETHAGDA